MLLPATEIIPADEVNDSSLDEVKPLIVFAVE